MICIISYMQKLSALLGRIEEESAEQWDPHAVVQNSKIGLCELKGCWVLVRQLPHAVQEQGEQWRLARRTNRN